VRQAGPGRLELGAEGDQEQRGQALHPLDHQVQQLARGRVDPVDVLVDHQHRPLPGQELELPEQRLGCPLLPPPWREIEGWVPAGGRDRQQIGQERHIVDGRRGRREQRLQLLEPRLGRVVAFEPGRAGELADDRVQGIIAVVRRAEAAQPGVRLVPEPFLQRGRDP
jgi:hypothetical protein